MNTPQKRQTSFDDFVNDQQVDETSGDTEFWKNELHEWLAYLDRLYATIEDYLKPYVEGGTIHIAYRDVEINEENIGLYQARQMLVKIGRQEVLFTPVGTVLFGTKGRVDVEGTAGRARLILTDRSSTRPQIKATIQRGEHIGAPLPAETTDIDWTWKIATNPPQITYIELTRQTLFDLVMEVANG